MFDYFNHSLSFLMNLFTGMRLIFFFHFVDFNSKEMLTGFHPCQPCWDTINDKDDFNINHSNKKYTINPLETEAERNIRTRTV